MPARQHEFGVPARHNQRKVREGNGRVGRLQERRIQMPLQVMHTHERAVQREGERLGGCQPDHQCADQAWAVRDGDFVDVRPADARRIECLLQDGVQPFHMLARGGFGHDPAPLRVQVYLRGDDA